MLNVVRGREGGLPFGGEGKKDMGGEASHTNTLKQPSLVRAQLVVITK